MANDKQYPNTLKDQNDAEVREVMTTVYGDPSTGEGFGPSDEGVEDVEMATVYGMPPGPDNSWLLGSSKDCDIRVIGLRVAPEHARIIKEGTSYTIFDLGTAGGTQVNGEKVNGNAPVKPGDTLRLGMARMVFRDETAK